MIITDTLLLLSGWIAFLFEAQRNLRGYCFYLVCVGVCVFVCVSAAISPINTLWIIMNLRMEILILHSHSVEYWSKVKVKVTKNMTKHKNHCLYRHLFPYIYSPPFVQIFMNFSLYVCIVYICMYKWEKKYTYIYIYQMRTLTFFILQYVVMTWKN